MFLSAVSGQRSVVVFMNDSVIKVENLSKQYRIGAREGYRTFRETLVDAAKAPFKQVLHLFNPTSGLRPLTSELIWALKDVSFEVKQGEVVGIIGRNGAGKSTLLKILSRITEPTEGRVEMRGRVGSLLEVGTGFHPELTGHENIYLYGAILGMDRWEVTRKFDEIVAFAELEKFIDTPVKKYSSGMYMRLAFAVAAHLEPEILLVDEVLAVGDAAFQKKCLGKMGDVSKQGRTVLFVSHNMGAITRLCSRSFWLDHGLVRMQGLTSEAIASYLREDLSADTAETRWAVSEAPGDEYLRLRSVRVCQPRGSPSTRIDITKPFEIEINTEVLKPTDDVVIGLRVNAADGQTVLHTADVMGCEIPTRQRGLWISVCSLPAYALNHGTYTLSVGADIPNLRMLFIKENVLHWTVETVSGQMGRYDPKAWGGLIGPGLARWSTLPVGESQKP
jgi:lipopolysaccharide transport system ATP-binding protein